MNPSCEHFAVTVYVSRGLIIGPVDVLHKTWIIHDLRLNGPTDTNIKISFRDLFRERLFYNFSQRTCYNRLTGIRNGSLCKLYFLHDIVRDLRTSHAPDCLLPRAHHSRVSD